MNDGRFPADTAGVFYIHIREFTRKQRRFRAARAGADFQKDALGRCVHVGAELLARRARLFCFGSGRGGMCARGFEFFHASGFVDEFAFAGEKRVAIRANFRLNFF